MVGGVAGGRVPQTPSGAGQHMGTSAPLRIARSCLERGAASGPGGWLRAEGGTSAPLQCGERPERGAASRAEGWLRAGGERGGGPAQRRPKRWLVGCEVWRVGGYQQHGPPNAAPRATIRIAVSKLSASVPLNRQISPTDQRNKNGFAAHSTRAGPFTDTGRQTMPNHKQCGCQERTKDAAPGVRGGRPPGKALRAPAERRQRRPSMARRRVATGANHPASRSSAFRRGPGTPAVALRRGTRAPI